MRAETWATLMTPWALTLMPLLLPLPPLPSTLFL
jgi:hypothetical protein